MCVLGSTSIRDFLCVSTVYSHNQVNFSSAWDIQVVSLETLSQASHWQIHFKTNLLITRLDY